METVKGSEMLQSRRDFYILSPRQNMWKKVLMIVIVVVSVLLWQLLSTSCSTTRTISFYCAEEFVEIYVDGEYAGRGLVHHSFPSSQKVVTVSCGYEGQEMYSRTYYVRGRNGETIELQIPKDYFYSTEKH